MRTYAIYTHIHFDLIWFGLVWWIRTGLACRGGIYMYRDREKRKREKKTRTKAGWVCECGLNTM